MILGLRRGDQLERTRVAAIRKIRVALAYIAENDARGERKMSCAREILAVPLPCCTALSTSPFTWNMKLHVSEDRVMIGNCKKGILKISKNRRVIERTPTTRLI
jgi:hypothetical protein